jgi:O-antigen ligase
VGAPSELADRWDSFTAAEGLDPDDAARGEQVLDVSARGRYQYWESSVDAFRTEPLLGIGPGTFEFWWAREGDPDAAIFVRNAHSLYLETLAELGIVGLLLVVGFAATVLVAASIRAWRAAPSIRPGAAAAAAACFVFAASALVDWVWELAALPVAFMFLVALAIASPSAAEPEARISPRAAPGLGPRLIGAVLCLVALVAIGLPLAAARSVEDSREQAAEENYDAALEDARDAIEIQPYAATPRIQEAVVLERLGLIDEAADAAREATARESTNWRLWLVLSRLEARRGDAEASVEALNQAESLFPRGFNQFL